MRFRPSSIQLTHRQASAELGPMRYLSFIIRTAGIQVFSCPILRFSNTWVHAVHHREL